MADAVTFWRVVGLGLAAAVVVYAASPWLAGFARTATARFVSRLTWRSSITLLVGLAAAVAHAHYRPWPGEGENVILDLVAAADPAAYTVLFAWSLALPGLAAGMTVLGASGAWRLWIAEPSRTRRSRGLLPPWPEENPDEPRLVIGELHHPTEGREIERPSWLALDERGLYTGIAIFGAIGTAARALTMRHPARSTAPFRPKGILFCWRSCASGQATRTTTRGPMGR